MRRDNLPHDGLEFEKNVGDVEDCQQPLVPVTVKIQVRGHPSDAGITAYDHPSAAQITHLGKDMALPDIGAVKERDKVYRSLNSARVVYFGEGMPYIAT